MIYNLGMGDNQKQSILLVGKDTVSQKAIRKILADLDVEVVTAESVDDVMGLVMGYDFALILFDVDPPDTRPFQTARILAGNEKTWFVPLIFQSEADDFLLLEEKGYDAGGVDFLTKPVNATILRAKVKVFLELDTRQRHLAFATNKIQEQNLRLEQRAIRDGLTGLYNHKHLQEQLAREVSLARRYHAPLSVFLMDLDFFKDVNDSCGHPFGDFVLKEFAARVKADLRVSDIFGRYGGEEFLVILPNVDRKKAEVVAEKIRKEVASAVFSNKRYSRYVTVSIGVYSGVGNEVVSPAMIVEYVDNALYAAKAEGRNRVVHYCTPREQVHSNDEHFSDIVGGSQQSQLNNTIEKARAMSLASFEAMVHSQTREYDMLVQRNDLFGKVLLQVADKLNLPEKLIHSFRRAIKLHDLFRCYIHDSSLETEGALSKEQEEMLFDQPLMLRELTTMFDFFASERVILYSHHEHYDGTGYPDGLKGNEIPMAARIFSVIDSFVAMIAPVANKKGMDVVEVQKEFRTHAGTQFDPFLVDVLMQVISDETFFLSEEGEADAGKTES